MKQTTKKALSILTALWMSMPFIASAQETIYGYEYVDLGLPSGILWATCNLGASSPEEYGNYYEWGETKHFTEMDPPGYLSNYSVLPAEYDAATVNLNPTWLANRNESGYQYVESWRMPTKEEMEELKNNTTLSNETFNGVAGRRLTSKKNGKSIFFPFGGDYENGEPKNQGIYVNLWTSSCYSPTTAYACWFKNSTTLTFGGVDQNALMPIRPVCNKLIKAESITLNFTSKEWEQHYCERSCQKIDHPSQNPHMFLLHATISPANATEQLVKFEADGNQVNLCYDDIFGYFEPGWNGEYYYSDAISSRWVYMENNIGSTIITASTTDGTNLSATCTVTVKPELVEGNTITYTSSDGQVIIPNNTNAFGANIICNVYQNGKGTITFDGEVTCIGTEAFRDCRSLTSIDLPSSLISIGESAFAWCI